MKRKIFFISIIMIMAVLLASCGKKGGTEMESETSVLMTNPWEDVDSLEHAASVAGFDISLPKEIDNYTFSKVQAIRETMIQAFYYETGNEKDYSLMIRKGTETAEDISGNHEYYPARIVTRMHGNDVHCRTDEAENIIYVATWVQNGYAYSIDSVKGMTWNEINNLMGKIH